MQVKFDGPGGSASAPSGDLGRDPKTGMVRIMVPTRSGTGFLFSQTHTLPLERAREWYDHDYKADGHELPIAADA